VSVVVTGLACGGLLTATGLVFWDSFQKRPGLSQALQAIRWLAGVLLLIGAVLAWRAGDTLFPPTMRLALMAALVTLPEIRRRPPSSWGNLSFVLIALILAGASLSWTSLQVPGAAGVESPTDSLPIASLRLAMAICGGLGTRALGEILSGIDSAPPTVEWPSIATHMLLTLLAAGMALTNVWRRGTIWIGATGAGGLTGAWLAWGAVRFGPRKPPWLRATLVTAAALLLILLAAGY